MPVHPLRLLPTFRFSFELAATTMVALACCVVAGDAFGFTRPATPPEPNSVDDALVTKYAYNAAGYQHEVIDNADMTTRTEYDALGRPRKVIENYVDGSPETGDADEDRTTLYAYNAAGQITKQTADLNDFSGSGGDQATHYIHSQELASPTSGGPVPSFGQLRAVVYPDALEDGETRAGVISKLNSATSGDFVETTYYADGAMRTRTDQRGVRLTYHYNADGTRKAQVASNFDADTDDSVKSMTYTYDDLQRLLAVSSHSSAQTAPTATDVVNQVTHEYTGMGQLAKQRQDIAPGSMPYQEVQYAYDASLNGNAFAKALRQTSVTYPNGRKLHTLYNAAPLGFASGGASIDDALSRPNGIANDAPGSPGTIGDPLVAYAHTGGGVTVAKDLPRIATRLDHFGQLAGDDPNDYLPATDRFGRVTRLRWDRYNPAAGSGHPLINAGSGGDPLFDLRHGYDRASNRLYTERMVYNDQDELYGHDNLQRLTRFDKGGLNGTQDAMAVLGFAQNWDLDALGNWDTFQQDDDGGTAFSPTPDPYDLEQDRNHNNANEILQLAALTPGTSTVATGGGPGGNTGPYTQALDPNNRVVIQAEGYDLKVDNNGKSWTLLDDYAEEWIRIRHVWSTSTPPGPEAIATYNVTIPAGEGGDYLLWGHAYTPNGRDSFWVRVDGGTWVKWNGIPAASGWTWDEVHDSDNGGATVNFNLAPGNRTIEIGCREPEANLDALYLTKDGDIPLGEAETGDGILVQAEDADTFGWRWEFQSVNNNKKFPDNALALQALPNTGTSYQTTYVTDSPRMDYQVDFDQAGTYYVHVRGNANHEVNGQNDDNSIHVGLNGSGGTADKMRYWYWEFEWKRDTDDGPVATLNVPSPGVHTLNVWMYEDGFIFDKIVLTQDANYSLGTYDYGPPTTPRAGQSVVSSGLSSGGVVPDPEHDAAGNLVRLTLPGRPGGAGWTQNVTAVYDAWNRLVEVIDDSDPQNPLPLSAMEYDGLGRRTLKTVTNSAPSGGGDFDFTYHYYYHGQQLVEIHNGTGLVIKQHVWGLDYIDELVEVAINQDPTDSHEQVCERPFYAMHNARYNVLGIAIASGGGGQRLVERYEYTPYGQRQVFSHGWLLADLNGNGVVDSADYTIWNDNFGSPDPAHIADMNGDGSVGAADYTVWQDAFGDAVPENDPLVLTPSGGTHRSDAGIPLNTIGHQGLAHDEETGLVYQRNRMWNVHLGRFNQVDPTGYPDGLHRYAGYHVMHFAVDPFGLEILDLTHATKPSSAVSIVRGGLGNGTDNLRWFSTSEAAGSGVPGATHTVHLEYSLDVNNTKDIPECVLRDAEQHADELVGKNRGPEWARNKWLKVAEWIHEQPETAFRTPNPGGRNRRGYHYALKDSAFKSSKARLMRIAGIGSANAVAALKLINTGPLATVAQSKLGGGVKGFFKYGGRALVVVGVGISAYEIYAAEDRTREVVVQAGGLAGGLTGAGLGAKGGSIGGGAIGSIFPGPGTVIGGVAGGIFGGIFGGVSGYIAAEAITETVYDWAFPAGHPDPKAN